MPEKEQCRNPWNKKCNNTEIAVYIIYNGTKTPICQKCWEEIAEKDIEW